MVEEVEELETDPQHGPVPPGELRVFQGCDPIGDSPTGFKFHRLEWMRLFRYGRLQPEADF